MTSAGPESVSRLPREVESGPRGDAVRAAIGADLRPLWPRGSLLAAHVPLSASVRAALAALGARGLVERGLEAADAALGAERRGLEALAEEVRARQGQRVSRVLVVSDDGAERFYRNVERLALAHAPRVLVCRVGCTSADLGSIVFGPGEVAKLVLTSHKRAAVSILEAMAGF